VLAAHLLSLRPALQAVASRLLVVRSRFTTLTGSIIEPLDLDRGRVVAEDLDDLDGAKATRSRRRAAS
jgi:hypothetical protein